MDTQPYASLLAALDEIDAAHQPRLLFTLLAEPDVWRMAPVLLADAEQADLYGPTL